MSRSRFSTGLAVLLALFVAVTGSAWAQSVRGAIAGTVTDPSGAVIVGAKITATNTGTGATSTATSSSAGTYHFPSIPLGTYTLSVTAPGFSPSTVSNVLVQIQSVAAEDIKLQPGTAAHSNCSPSRPTWVASSLRSRLWNCRWPWVGSAHCALRRPLCSCCRAVLDRVPQTPEMAFS